MHISDGVLDTEIIVGGFVFTAAAISYSLKGLEQKDIPKISLMTAVFFVTSLLSINFLGQISIHLVLSGIMGIILKRKVFPAIFIGLLFQSIMFSHGGVSVLGVSTFYIGLPSYISYLLFKFLTNNKENNKLISVIGAICSIFAIVLSALIIFFIFTYLGESFSETIKYFLSFQLPLALIEGLISYFIIFYLLKIKPELIYD